MQAAGFNIQSLEVIERTCVTVNGRQSVPDGHAYCNVVLYFFNNTLN